VKKTSFVFSCLTILIAISTVVWAKSNSSLGTNLETGERVIRTFGTCCKDLGDALSQPQHSFFRVEENGVLYMTIGYIDTEKGPSFFDQAVVYCPFCGKQLQTKDEIKTKGGT
jgi:hypothetical protein